VAITAELIANRRHASSALPHLSWFKGAREEAPSGRHSRILKEANQPVVSRSLTSRELFCYCPHMSGTEFRWTDSGWANPRAWGPTRLYAVAAAGAGQALSRDTFLSAAIRSLSWLRILFWLSWGKNEEKLAPIAYAAGAAVVSNPDPAADSSVPAGGIARSAESRA
jgi:hypothetical protein